MIWQKDDTFFAKMSIDRTSMFVPRILVAWLTIKKNHPLDELYQSRFSGIIILFEEWIDLSLLKNARYAKILKCI